ncbi:MAG: glycosyltransferase family 2 protein [Deltaproteobacteria bacterium]|nr:glycosyltransferase family 2 protein [Deltaproteobacteria bacterium]
MRIAVLMPAFNEEGRLAHTLSELRDSAEGHELTVFLVDDGSSPPIDEAAVRVAAGDLRVVLSRHAVNLGQGAAIETARRLAIDPRWGPRSTAGRSRATAGYDAFVTMDSDGQHAPSDVIALARAITSGADVALGDRFAGGSQVPASRRVLLFLARAFERLTTGVHVSDAHNGLRAFSPRAIEGMQIRQNRMAHASEITRLISASRLEVVEVPVSVRYSAESLAKGQRASGAVAILVDLFQGFLFGADRR